MTKIQNKLNTNAEPERRHGIIRKWMIRIPLYFLFGIILLVGMGVLLLQTGIARDILRGFLIDTANKKLNATLGIERIDGNLLTDISLEGISMRTPDDQTVLFIENVSAHYLLPMMLTRIIHVGNARIEGLRLNGVKTPGGEWNFSNLLKASNNSEKTSSTPFPFLIAIKRFEIADALLSIEEPEQEETTIRSFQIDRLTAGIEYGERLLFSILDSSLVLKTTESLPIALTGKAVFDPEATGIKIDHLTIQSGLSVINVDGSCRFEEKYPTVDCSIGLANIDLEDIGRKLHMSSLPEDTVSGDIKISGTLEDVHHKLFLQEERGGILEMDGTSGFNDSRGLWTDLSGSIRSLDLSKLGIPITEHLSGVVSSDISLKGTNLQKTETMDASASLAIRGISAGGIPLDVFRLNADASRGKVTIEQFEVLSGEERLGIFGSIEPFNRSTALDLTLHLEQPEILLNRLSNHLSQIPVSLALQGETDITVALNGWFDNPQARFSIKTPIVSAGQLNVESLDLTGDLQGLPMDEDSRANLALTAGGMHMDGIESGAVSLTGTWKGPFSGYKGHAELNVKKIDIKNNPFKGIFLTANVTPDEAVLYISAEHANGSRFEIDGKATPWLTSGKDITIGKLRLVTGSPWPEAKLINKDPIRFLLDENKRIRIRDCRFEINDTEIAVEGNLAANGEQDLKIAVDNLELRDIPGKWNTEARLSGTVSAKTTIRGTLGQPIISALVNVKNLMGYGISKSNDLNAAVDYAEETADFQATLLNRETPVFAASGSAPVRFSLAPFSVEEAPGDLEATLETQKLRFSELPIPRMEAIDWDAVADIKLYVSGGIRQPDISGNIAIHDGYLTLTRNKLTYEQVEGKLLLSNNRLTVEELTIAGDREGRLGASGIIVVGDKHQFDTDITVDGDDFYIPFQKAVSARITPRLHLTGGLDNPKLEGEVTITESKINLDRLAAQQHGDIQVVETAPEGSDTPLIVASEAHGPDYLSPLFADIIVRVPKNAWLKGQDVNAEIAGEIAIKKKPEGTFRLSGPLRTLRGNYYFMGKNFHLTKGNVEFLGLREINPNLNIEARTRIKSTDIIVTLHGPANEIAIDLSSDPVMEESDIISYLVFGRPSDSIGGNQAFNVEKAALSITGGLLAAELRNILGDVFFIDSFAIDSGDSENGFGSVTLGKYVTPEIFISHRQGLTENDASYEEITYELTPQLKLEAQIGRDNTSSADLTWEFDF